MSLLLATAAIADAISPAPAAHGCVSTSDTVVIISMNPIADAGCLTVAMSIPIPNSRGAIGTPRGYLNVLIDLANGAVSLPSGAEWDAAMAAAAPLTARSKASEATWRAFAMVVPLVVV